MWSELSNIFIQMFSLHCAFSYWCEWWPPDQYSIQIKINQEKKRNICFFNTSYNTLLKTEYRELLIHHVVTGFITKCTASKWLLKIVIWCTPSVGSCLTGFFVWFNYTRMRFCSVRLNHRLYTGRICIQMRTSPEGSKKHKEQTKSYYCFLWCRIQ